MMTAFSAVPDHIQVTSVLQRKVYVRAGVMKLIHSSSFLILSEPVSGSTSVQLNIGHGK